jgi:hypothetical protein
MPGSGPGGRWFKSIRPDHLFRICNLQNIKFQRAPSAGLRCRRLKSICLNRCLFFQINALHSVLDYAFYFILRTTRTTSVFSFRFGVSIRFWATDSIEACSSGLLFQLGLHKQEAYIFLARFYPYRGECRMVHACWHRCVY